MKIPPRWKAALGDEANKPYFRELVAFLETERTEKSVFPEEDEVFRALSLTPLDSVKVLLLGQDPYHDDGQAHGLCFSVRPPTRPPPSLKNIFRELKADLGVEVPEGVGDLTAWAEQGVLLLNTVLTVVAHEPASHKNKGWEMFTDAVITKVNENPQRVVFCLWGAHAQKKAKLVDTSRHVVIESAHPSPLSVKKFVGTRPFSKINAALIEGGRTPIDWSLTSRPTPS
jgi:uracil-DNA glycosylase